MLPNGRKRHWFGLVWESSLWIALRDHVHILQCLSPVDEDFNLFTSSCLYLRKESFTHVGDRNSAPILQRSNRVVQKEKSVLGQVKVSIFESMFLHAQIHSVAVTLVHFQHSLCPSYCIFQKTGFQTFSLGSNKEVVLQLLLVGTHIPKHMFH